MLVSTGLPGPTTMLFNRLIRALLLKIGREPMNVNKYDEYYEALKSRQEAFSKGNDIHKDSILFSSGSTVVVQMENRGPWTHGIIESNSIDHQGQSYQV